MSAGSMIARLELLLLLLMLCLGSCGDIGLRELLEPILLFVDLRDKALLMVMVVVDCNGGLYVV
jgi:hypothetical protein